MILAFIPVRGGSKSIPLKNIKDFCGKPLVYWNLRALEDAPSIDKVIVATDSDEIAKVVESFCFSKVSIFRRSSENASDTASTESVMLEYLDNQALDGNDLFVLAQATSPLTQAKDFEGAINKLIKSKAESLVSCVRTKRFFWGSDALPLNYVPEKRPRRQDFDGLLMENGAFYINSVKNIFKYKNRITQKVCLYEMPEFTGIEIDEEDDWLLAEHLMKKHILSKECKKRIIKLFLSDVDGTLTDAGMYYGDNGIELKKFNTHDGKGFEILRNSGVYTGILTSESNEIVSRRARKLKVDFVRQGLDKNEKLLAAQEICKELKISMDEVAYIGDDINCKEILLKVGLAACPSNAVESIKNIQNIIILKNMGGQGAVREFIDKIIDSKY